MTVKPYGYVYDIAYVILMKLCNDTSQIFQDIGDNIITVPEVVSEIRDKATRERLQVLPYDLHFKQPQPEAIKAGMFKQLILWYTSSYM